MKPADWAAARGRDGEPPARSLHAAVGYQARAIGGFQHAERPVLGGDPLDQIGGAPFSGVARAGLARGAERGEAGIGDHLALVGQDQVGGALGRVADRPVEIGAHRHGRAPGADEAVADIDGRQTGDREVGRLAPHRALEAGAARQARRIVGRLHQLGHLHPAEVQTGRRRLAIEAQLVGPIRPEHHHPALGREEEEVVQTAVARLAVLGDHVGGGEKDVLVRGRHLVAVGEEGAQAVNLLARGLPNAAEQARRAAAGAVAPQRKLAVELSRRLGVRQGRETVGEGLAGARVLGGHGVEQPPLGAGARARIEVEIGDLLVFGPVQEDHEGSDRHRRRQPHRQGDDGGQKFARERDALESGVVQHEAAVSRRQDGASAFLFG